jgi:hypothetical protein
MGEREFTDSERIDALERWGMSYAASGSFSENIVELERFDECEDEDCDGSDCECAMQEWCVIGPQESAGVWLTGSAATLREAIDDALRAEADPAATLKSRIASHRGAA